jgi:hypothetical protein
MPLIGVGADFSRGSAATAGNDAAPHQITVEVPGVRRAQRVVTSCWPRSSSVVEKHACGIAAAGNRSASRGHSDR